MTLTPRHTSGENGTSKRPHIVLIIPRGEAVRNFLYSDTLPALHKQARVTLLSVIDDERFLGRFRPYTEQIIPLHYYPERRPVTTLRHVLHEAHFRWMWTQTAQNVWEIRAEKAKRPAARLRWLLFRSWAFALGNRFALENLSRLERFLTWRLRPSDDFVQLFRQLQPDLVFNGSHIHGPASHLPVEVARRLGIPTAGFIFSWDNLTNRSRVFEQYDTYFVWHEQMRQQLLSLYPFIESDRVVVTGTPQFDFHFKPTYQLSREELARCIGIDERRPFIFYTTGMDKHFPEEHRHVSFIADYLQRIHPDVQLVVRTYVKGTSPEMKAVAAQNRPNVVFPRVQWDEQWFMPMYEDLAIYSSCLRHAAMGINPASTVSLELMMFDKPVMNIGFDPPGSTLPHAYRWQRHIEFDHYRPVADSGAVMVAYSTAEAGQLITRGLTQPDADRLARQRYLKQVFNGSLDGRCGERIAAHLLALARSSLVSRR